MIYHFFNGRVLHLTPAIISGIVNSFPTNNDKNHHYFCIVMFGEKMLYKNVDENPYSHMFEDLKYEKYQIIESPMEYIRLFLKMNDKDRIIYHSIQPLLLFFSTNIFLSIFKKKVIHYSSFICWGSDANINNKNIKQKTHALLMKTIFRKLSNVIAISTDDQKEIKEMYPDANVILLPYYSSNKICLLEKKSNSKFHVMVSHSGWPHNKHIDSFEMLGKFKGKLEITCPLCYGDPAYIETVISRGKELFGNDFHYFKDLMERKDYANFMRGVDAYVTSAEIQTGLGAITYAIQGGAKIFITGNVFNFLKPDYIVFNTKDISQMSFEEFSKPLTYEERLSNVEKKNLLNNQNVELYKNWVKVFNN